MSDDCIKSATVFFFFLKKEGNNKFNSPTKLNGICSRAHLNSLILNLRAGCAEEFLTRFNLLPAIIVPGVVFVFESRPVGSGVLLRY